MTDRLTTLLQRVDEPAARYAQLDAYYAGQQPLAFLSPDARKALGNRLTSLSVNLPRLVVSSVAERLRVTGFSDPSIWADWLRNDLDQLSGVAHVEALVLGSAYVVVWADASGEPRVSVESARQTTCITDPGSRQIVAALKRWTTEKTTEAVLYEADKITRLRADTIGATTAGFRTVEVIANPLGVVPVVRLRNASRLLDQGTSEMADVLSLADAIVKINQDMMTASEFTARPRRWATGVELTEEDVLDAAGQPTGETVEVNPIPEGSRSMISEDATAKFGQLQGADLAGYDTALGALYRQISAVTGIPEHMLGIGGDNPTSADSIRASEAALTAKAEARQQVLGRSWEAVGRLIMGVKTGLDPNGFDVRVQWADPSTRSQAAEADAVVKLFASGLLPQRYALEKLGYAPDEIDKITNQATRGDQSLI